MTFIDISQTIKVCRWSVFSNSVTNIILEAADFPKVYQSLYVLDHILGFNFYAAHTYVSSLKSQLDQSESEQFFRLNQFNCTPQRV